MQIEVDEDCSNVRLTGNQIRHIREVIGETQAQFARRFGVSQPSVYRWESKGDALCTGPEIVLAQAIADHFKIKVPPVPVDAETPADAG